MKLTPIRVRGKRGQPRPAKKASARSGQTADAGGGGGTREAKRAKRHHRKADDAARGMLKKGLPRLSQLPQEILERVFIASKNLSLPRVNKDLYHRLTTDSIKYQLVGAAFGPTWEAWYGLDGVDVSSYEGWISDAERIDGDPAFQSAVLACSWAKLPILLDAFDVWIRQHARGRAYFTIPELKTARLGTMVQPGSLFDQAYNNTDLLGAPGETPCSTMMTMRSKFHFDLGRFQRRFSSWEHLPEPSPPGSLPVDDATYLQALLSSHLEVHPGASIPDDVLSGPFESEDGDVQVGEERMLRLFWLVRGGACLQREQTWEVTRQGFREILQLLKGAEAGVAKDEEAATRRVQLAWRLFALFGVLGVFENQWPKYITQTSLVQARTQISQPVPLVHEMATKLQRVIFGSPRGNFHTGCGWRWRPRTVHGGAGADGFLNRPTQSLATWHLIQRQYASFFLVAPDDAGQQPSAALGGRDEGAGGGGVVVHEPWSDFGPDF